MPQAPVQFCTLLKLEQKIKDLQYELTLIRCQFHQCFMYNFYACRSQKRKKIQLSHKYLFMLSGSANVKAVLRTLMKSTEGEIHWSIYQMITRAIGLNVVYLLILKNDSTEHVSTQEGSTLLQVKGSKVSLLCYVHAQKCVCSILSIHVNISVGVSKITHLLQF